MEEDRLMLTMLLDFYGELLTDKQRRCLELHCNEDLSLSEIAEQCGVSRQGVWDNIRRAEAAMKDMEEKTGLIRRSVETREALEKLQKPIRALRELSAGQARELADEAARQLSELLERV